jgi:uncharacterized protein
MFRFGADFRAARANENYSAVSGQWWVWVVLFLLLQILVLYFVQGLAAIVAYYAMCGGLPDLSNLDANLMAMLAKASLVGMLPASLLMAGFAWWCAGLVNKTGDRGIPLHWPDMGVGGWVVTIGGVIVFLYCTYIVTFFVLGIDPQTYAPTANGVNDATSASGLVEKTMADLADEPLLFALALPGIILGAPISEELIFRGALFSRLRNSWFGKTGAVVITAALWAVVHGASAPWLFVFVIFIMGLLLGWLLLRFGSLWVTIVVHAAWNGFSSLAIFGGVSGS